MNPQSQCLIRAITGPIILITVGVLFLLERLPAHISFMHTTWPVLLIVVGLLRLLGGRGPRGRPSGYMAPPYVATPYTPPYTPPYNPAAPPPPPVPGERR